MYNNLSVICFAGGLNLRIIAGAARGLKLLSLDGLDTRPTLDRVKEPLFSMLMPYIEEKNVLDLFSGSGALGLEALSRGAKKCTFVDKNPKCRNIIEANINKARFSEKSTVKTVDFAKFLSGCTDKFDLVFLDPPYAEVFLENALRKISEIDILSDSGIIICERPAEKQLPGDFSGLLHYRDYRYGKAAVTLYRKA